MSSWDLTSTVGAISSKSAGSADAPTKRADSPSESFGKLFGRVFGDAPVRQDLAARGDRDTEDSKKIRTVLLGSDTQLITAGDPPTEEEILAFAREANLDETSLKALLLTAPDAMNELKEVVDEPSGDPTQQGLDAFGTSIDVAVVLANSSSLESRSATAFSPLSPTGHLTTGALVSSALWAQSLARSAEADSSVASRGVREVVPFSKPTDSLNETLKSVDPFRISVVATDLLKVGHDRSSKEFLDTRLSVDALGLKEEGGDDQLAVRLGLKGMDGAVSMEALLKTIQEKKKLTLQDPIKLQLADPSRGPDPWALDTMIDSDGDAGHDARSSLGATGTLGLESSVRSGGGSMGDSGQQSRGDPNAGPKVMSQQVMQRFGEILGQRLLQQINQGDWKVEIALEPADLGSIQIELEWRKGELEASFKAGQALTRDLLQDGLPRLRETLERAGIDVASVYVGDQGREQSSSGRPGQSGSGEMKQSQSSDQGNGVEGQAADPQGLRPDNGRLDVLV